MSVALPGPVAKQMRARTAVTLVVGLLALAAGVGLFIDGQRGAGGAGGAAGTPVRLAPAFSLPELRPERPAVTLASTPGKPTVVNFFAAWCEPCKKELPVLREASLRHAGTITFLGVDHQDSRSDAIERLDEFGITYPAGYDPKGEIAARYGLRGLPATVFIDADGRIVDLHQGQISSAELEERLRRLTLQSRTP
ncbi:MAG: TlpA family protein disulfide reductase [Actinobacteria bacterium]|nr:TlpA family protein disulfide reductase [Actinomycetota bacterium]